MTIRLAALCTYAVLASCEVSPAPAKSGWLYDLDPKWPGAIYNFADQANSKVYGRCHAGPVFSLSGGDYASGSKSFALGTDGKWRNFEAFDGHHGRLLIVEGAEAIHDLSVAKTITFRVGDWERTVPGSSFIARLIRDCEKLEVQRRTSDREAQR